MIEALILLLPDFSNEFEVASDASHIGFIGVPSQEGHHIPFFSEKLNGSKKKHSTYDMEFNVVVQAFTILATLSNKEFIIYSNRKALKFLNPQKKLDRQSGKWSKFV